MIDGSESVCASDYEIMRQFVRDVAASMDIGPDATNVGIAEFSTDYNLVDAFFDSARDFEVAVDAAFQSNGITHTASALTNAAATFDERGRDSAGRVVVVVTDGKVRKLLVSAFANYVFQKASPSETISVTQALQTTEAAKIQSVVIGIGCEVDNVELESLAGGLEGRFMSVPNASSLSDIDTTIAALTENICSTYDSGKSLP